MKKKLSEIAEVTSLKLTSENKKDFAKAIWFELQKQKKLGQIDTLILQIKEKFAVKSGKVLARVFSADQLSNEDMELIKEKLEKRYSEKINIENVIDRSLIGGFKISIQDEVLDFSHKSKLNKLREKLAG